MEEWRGGLSDSSMPQITPPRPRPAGCVQLQPSCDPPGGEKDNTNTFEYWFSNAQCQLLCTQSYSSTKFCQPFVSQGGLFCLLGSLSVFYTKMLFAVFTSCCWRVGFIFKSSMPYAAFVCFYINDKSLNCVIENAWLRNKVGLMLALAPSMI